MSSRTRMLLFAVVAVLGLANLAQAGWPFRSRSTPPPPPPSSPGVTYPLGGTVVHPPAPALMPQASPAAPGGLKPLANPTSANGMPSIVPPLHLTAPAPAAPPGTAHPPLAAPVGAVPSQVAPAAPAAAPAGPEVGVAVRAVLDAQVQAWNRGDLVAFMAGYWSSPELVFLSGKDRTQGWQATLDRYRKKYQSEGQEMGKLTFSEIDVITLGPDAVLVRGRWSLARKKDNPAGLFTLLFRKLPAGWKIVHDHTSG